MTAKADTAHSDTRPGDCLTQRIVTHPTGRLLLETLTHDNMSTDYLTWLQDPEVIKYLEVRHTVRSDDTIREFVQDMLMSTDDLLMGIFLKKERRHIGNIKLGPVNWRERRAFIGLMIGDKTCWGKGYATEAIDGMCYVAFDVLALKRVEAGAYVSNKRSIKAFLNADFSREEVRKGQYSLDGHPEDHVILGRVA
jgi:ribosomal-protein-alanine N-acetyltransferase